LTADVEKPAPLTKLELLTCPNGSDMDAAIKVGPDSHSDNFLCLAALLSACCPTYLVSSKLLQGVR
jgi:hypothetical protein